jgi:hypothetical protein
VLYGVDAKTNHPYLAAIGVSATISFLVFLFFLVGKSSEYLIWSLFFVGIQKWSRLFEQLNPIYK